MYILQFNAYHPKSKVVKGIKFNKGGFAGGYVCRSPILNESTGCLCLTLEDVKHQASLIWKKEFAGYFKEICVKYMGSVVFEARNYDLIYIKGESHFKPKQKV